MLQRMMLSREEEAASGPTDEIRREDQDNINRFSRLDHNEDLLEDEMKAKQKDKEELEDILNELELADEDEKVPYKIGDVFLSLPLPEVQELLSASISKINEEVSTLEEKISSTREEKEQLKIHLYARFGKGINLEK